MKSCQLVPPVVVWLVRLAPRMLDDDNAVSSMKAVRDAIAAHFGVDDRRRDLVRFEVAQAYAPEPAVFVEIERAA